MKLPGFRKCVLISVALVLTPTPRSEGSAYCPGCGAAIAGAAVGVGALAGITIYAVHRSRTSLKGCVQQTRSGFSLIAKDGKSYELMSAPAELKGHRRVSLRGHKGKSASGATFRVDRLSHDFGECTQ